MSSTHIPKRKLAIIDDDLDGLTVEEPCSPAHPRHIYSPLPRGDYFRLLELLPGEPGTTLHGNLAHYDLDAFNVPPYKALSYTWGESKYDRLIVSGHRVPLDSALRKDYDIRHPLYCDGKRLLISTNLRDALRRIRHRFLPMKLWIDAVCINQQDDIERGAQIMLMTRIYHHASPVLLWLGEEDEDTVPAFDLIRLLAQAILKIALTERTFAGPLNYSNASERLRAVGVPPVEAPQYGSLIRLLNRPVFRRIWCVQEAAVAGATNIICGDAERPPLLYATITTAIMVLQKAGWKSQLQRQHAAGWDVLYFPEVVGITQRNWFENALDQQGLAYALRMFEASDPRDKVFAILGLLGNYAHRRLHELVETRHEDECKDGHAFDCSHWREQTRNWAQTKLEGNGGLNALLYAANSRIYYLVDQLTRFFDAVIDLMTLIRAEMNAVLSPRERSMSVEEAVRQLDLNDSSAVESLRVTADGLYIHVRHILDKMANEFVSSHELAAYNWASKAIEDFTQDYDNLHAIYMRGQWSLNDADYLEDIFAEIKQAFKLLKEGSDYSPSRSSRKSSSCAGSEVEQDDQASEMGRPTSARDVPQKGEPSDYDDSDAAPHQDSELVLSGPSEHCLPENAPKLCSDSEKLDKGRLSNTMPFLDQLSNILQVPTSANDSFERLGGPSDSYKTCDDDIMVVHKDELPAEISLMAGSSGWNKVIGLEYMAPREPAERPVLTAEPLQPWGADLTLLPDYRLSMAEVYSNFTIQCMIQSNSIDMLSSIDIAPKSGTSDLPSWVPDFRGNPYSIASSIILSEHPSQFKQQLVSIGEPEISWDPSDSKVLGLTGQIVDTLKTVSTLRLALPGLKYAHEEWERLSGIAVIQSSESHQMDLSAYTELLKKGIGLTDGAAPKCPPTFKSWDQLIGDLSRWFNPINEQTEDLSEQTWKCYFAFLVFLQVQQAGLLAVNEIEDKLVEFGIDTIMNIVSLSDAIRAIVVGRRMVYTEKGHIAFVPENAEVGDRVCMFKGGRIPCLIRQGKATGSNVETSFVFQGECFSSSMTTEEFRKSLGVDWQMIKLT